MVLHFAGIVQRLIYRLAMAKMRVRVSLPAPYSLEHSMRMSIYIVVKPLGLIFFLSSEKYFITSFAFLNIKCYPNIERGTL